MSFIDYSKTNAAKQFTEQQNDIEQKKLEMTAALGEFLEDCHYAVSKNGDILDTSYFKAIVGYHMIRCGWRRVAEPVIKKRRVIAPGVIEDACEWVDINEPDDPLENLENMSVRELAELSPEARAAAIRRLGGDYDHDLPEPEVRWSVTPNITITDDPVTGEDLIGGPNA
ncbi:hypothetical protein PBI_GAIA_19 [Mycobacterium phage Gaia]|uniref:Minor tail protein n=1 Tax=Mycobacterium phage Gaia TaxID=1486472 RepID=A0A068F2D2_9CAUD|nr:minor tail protein [Mycobacterium phage Gaia]AID58839.1 hypothetical protein PBI_GAIA_19 [Mycobacterium phage Gaia]AYQ99961.1 hypothetical protein PBI_NEBKISS_20 [Mycobacterium phage Nebkiss]